MECSAPSELASLVLEGDPLVSLLVPKAGAAEAQVLRHIPNGESNRTQLLPLADMDKLVFDQLRQRWPVPGQEVAANEDPPGQGHGPDFAPPGLDHPARCSPHRNPIDIDEATNLGDLLRVKAAENRDDRGRKALLGLPPIW
jgi:hypothetical protein